MSLADELGRKPRKPKKRLEMEVGVISDEEAERERKRGVPVIEVISEEEKRQRIRDRQRAFKKVAEMTRRKRP